jgi:NAD-dependent deacetylase
VYPAAGILEVAARAGATLIEVNPEATPFSPLAALTLRRSAGEALPALAAAMAACRGVAPDEEAAP